MLEQVLAKLRHRSLHSDMDEPTASLAGVDRPTDGEDLGYIRRPPWSLADVQLLRRRHAEGLTSAAIAIELDRTAPAVSIKAYRIGLRRVGP